MKVSGTFTGREYSEPDCQLSCVSEFPLQNIRCILDSSRREHCSLLILIN